MAKFQPGQSGNPAGKPKGTKDSRTALREMLKPHTKDLVDVVVSFAKSGDMAAMRIVMERLMPPVKEEPIRVDLPEIAGIDDCGKAQAALVNAAAAGKLLPSEARLMCELIDAQRRAFETNDVARRLEAIEEALRRTGGKS